jgi:competence protein ComEC
MAAAFIGGILLSSHLPAPGLMVLAAAGVVALLVLAALVTAYHNGHWLLLVLFLISGLALGRLALEEISSPLPQYAGHYVTVEGVVIREPEVFPDRVNYVLQVRQLNLGDELPAAGGLVLVRAPQPGEVYGYGSILRAHGLLQKPQAPGNPGQFDYGAYIKRRGMEVILQVDDPGKVSLLGSGLGNPLVDAALKVKAAFRGSASATLTAEQQAMLGGMVFGSRGQLSPEIKDAFNATGLGHVLSVSGLHVGLVLGGFLGLTRLLGMPLKLGAPLAGLLVVFYAVMTGLGPAVVRAGVMGLLVLLAHLVGRERDWPSAMALAALVVLWLSPLSLFEAGFQLSFAATWGILYLGPALNRWLAEFPWLPGWLRALIWVPLGAQLGTLPLVAVYFNLVSPVSLFANIIAVPLVGIIILLGIAGSVAGLILLPLGQIINAGTGTALDLFTWLIMGLSSLPGAALYVASPQLPLIAVWYVLLAVAALPARERAGTGFEGVPAPRPGRAAGAVVLAAAGLLALLLLWPSGRAELEVHFIDVGQGDAILVSLPSGRHMLVDAGGWPEELDSGEGAGRRVVVPYLRQLGINRLDLLVLTHPHEDHAGGARAVINSVPAAMVLVSPAGFGPGEQGVASGYDNLLAALRAENIPVIAVRAGDRINLDQAVEIRVLAPPSPLLTGTRSDLNNASLVLRLDYGETSVLLTGDIEVEAQKWLLDKGAPLGASLLKVPHHGSRFFEPAFLAAVSPQAAVISVGQRNNFNHPAATLLEALQEGGVPVYRTDLDGAVIIRSDGKSLTIRPSVNRRDIKTAA